MLTIRRAGEADCEIIRRFMEKLEHPLAFPEEPFRKNYLRNLSDPDLSYLVAEDGDAVAAFGSLHISRPLHHTAPVAEIVELIVDERRRGRGIGARMVDAMLALALDAGCCSLEVASNSMRTRAHGFYVRHGFRMSHVKLTMDLRNLLQFE